ncbi:MAG: four helix bundle protein [Bacteroidota bacterium]
MKHNFKKLEIWKRSRAFVKEIYLTTKKFPKEELFGLTAQIRKAVISIPSNIAEGCGRSSNAQLVHFLDISIASNCEVETQLYVSYDLEYVSEKDLNRLVQEAVEIRRMTIKFQQRHK